MDRLIAGILLLVVTSLAAPAPDVASTHIIPPTETLAGFSTSAAVGIGSLIVNAFNAAPTQQKNPTSTATSSAFPPEATVCGDIINAHNKDQRIVFPATQAYDCLTSVPFNPAVAKRFLQYYNDTMQFQSTLAYLKNPPSSYQQPPIDLMESFRQIEQNIDNGFFQNQYAFEATLQKVIYSTHDAHVRFDAGILAAFSFFSPYGITSVSSDGSQLPKVYLSKHLNTDKANASPITTINDQDVISFLSQFAALNAVGGLEPHTDWNSLMSSHALGIQGRFNYFGGLATFYPGDTITFTLENNTKITDQWRAYYNSPGSVGALATGGDFYNFFVLGIYPASYNPKSSRNNNSKKRDKTFSSFSSPTTNLPSKTNLCNGLPTSTGWSDSAYPTADIAQPELAVNGGGFLSGYFLKDASIAVLSIPSFEEYGRAKNTFSQMIKCFIESSHNANMKKMVIDVQQNQGGNTVTNVWDTLPQHDYGYYLLSPSEWVASDRLNAGTSQNFTSWQEMYGPHEYNGDTFTTNQRYNLSSYIFDVESLASSAAQSTTANDLQDPPSTIKPPYEAKDIVILSDGLCSSSCALFLEMMHHQAHVKTVVVGGKPNYGPMQAPAGSRGARAYTAGTLDEDFTLAKNLNKTTQSLLPSRKHDLWIRFAGFNLRDQIRKEENAVPLQFVYEPADCRIFYTKETYNNYNLLWRYAAEAIWSDPAKCVKDSTGYARYGSDTDTSGPPQPPLNNDIVHGMPGVAQLGGSYNNLPVSSSRALSDSGTPIPCYQGHPCQPIPGFTSAASQICPHPYDCVKVQTCSAGSIAYQYQCWPICSTISNRCQYGACQYNNKAVQQEYGVFWIGICPPRPVSQPCGSTSVIDKALRGYAEGCY